MEPSIYTVGHSNHPEEYFVQLLKSHQITALADVRSTPQSRYNPHFNRENLHNSLERNSIHYAFLGRELGARSDDPGCYQDGRIQYRRLAISPLFQQGLIRLQKGMQHHRLAMMCAEKEPLDCHRTILISRHLCALGIRVNHILADGALEDHSETLQRLSASLGLRDDMGHMFRTHEDLLEDAYTLQEERIAYAAEPRHPLA